MLSSGAREILTGVEAIIIDEIHAVAATKRGAHLALTLERLAANQADGHEPQRIGLSRDAEPARGGRPLHGRPAAHVHDRRRRRAQAAGPADPRAGRVDDRARAGARPAPTRSTRWSTSPAARPRAARSGRRSTRRSCGSSRSTARRSSSSTRAAAPSASRCGSTSSPTPTCRDGAGAGRHRPRPPRLARARGAHGRRGDAQGRRAALPRGDVVAGARHRHGRGRPRPAGRVAEVRRPRPAAHRPRRPQRRRRLQGPHLPEVPRRPARVRGRLQAHARRARSSRPSCRATRSTCSPSTSSRSPPAQPEEEPVAVDDLYAMVTRTHSYAELSRALLENVLDMLDGRYPSQEFAELRARIVWDRVGGTIRPRKGARQLAITNAGTIPDRGLFSVTLPDGRRVGELDEEMVYEARAGQTFLLGASTWRIEEIGRDRVIVTPAPGAPGARAVLEGRRRRPAEGARPGDRRVQPLGGRPGAGDAAGRLRPRRVRGEEPARLPARAAGRDARAAERPHDRRRALPRRDRRLAPVRPVALRRARPRRLGARPLAPHPRALRPGVRRDLVRRRDHRPPARRRRAAGRRAGHGRARRGAGGGRRRAGVVRACSARASARTPAARCSSRAPTRASARRCGSSA